MKTERFDEEFRRKLLGLPAEADPGEVERIHGFVNANKSALPSWGWGKLLLYGGSSLLLLGSLSYNVIQTYRNTRLQSSFDSLAHRSVVQTMPSEVIRHDTVYITRSKKTEPIVSVTEPVTESKTTGKEPLEQGSSRQSNETRRDGSVAIGNASSPQLSNEARSSPSEANSPRTSLRSTTPVATTESAAPNQHTEKSSQVRTEADRVIETSPGISSDRLLTEKTSPISKSERINKPAPTGVERVEGVYLTADLPTTTRSKNRRRHKGQQSFPSSDRHDLLATNQSNKQDKRTASGPSSVGFTTANTESPRSGALISGLNRQPIPVGPLASRQPIPSTQLAIISPSRPLIIPIYGLPAKATRQPRHSQMPDLSVPTAQYRIGAGLTGGDDQLGGALLGEVMLNPRWSVQAGLRIGYGQGFHYGDEHDFNEHQHADFRQKYASQVSSSSDIEDIKQVSLLVQAPLQVAYHLPIGRKWNLRLGAGTDLDVWVHSAIRYDYRENSRSSEHALSQTNEPVHVFNNLTLSTAVERSWRKWVFRAGPFISPQLRPVNYKPDDLSWGANLQLLYRIGK